MLVLVLGDRVGVMVDGGIGKGSGTASLRRECAVAGGTEILVSFPCGGS